MGAPMPGLQDEIHRLLILVVDDDPDDRTVFAARLAELGHDVLQACDADEALARIDRWPDLVMIDLDVDGRELARQLRETAAGEHSFLVAMSDPSERTDPTPSRPEEFDDHAVKPLGRDRVLELLRSVGARQLDRR